MEVLKRAPEDAEEQIMDLEDKFCTELADLLGTSKKTEKKAQRSMRRADQTGERWRGTSHHMPQHPHQVVNGKYFCPNFDTPSGRMTMYLVGSTPERCALCPKAKRLKYV
jgi:hypothetical protein